MKIITKIILLTLLCFSCSTKVVDLDSKPEILPEENAMLDLFKDEFLEYKKNVRRWI